MKIHRARQLVTENIEMMSLEQLQKHRVDILDAWRQAKADYGMEQAVRDGFYRLIAADAVFYTPTDLWLTQNLTTRLDEIDRRETMLLKQL